MLNMQSTPIIRLVVRLKRNHYFKKNCKKEKKYAKKRPILTKHWLELIFLNDNENYVFELEKKIAGKS